MTTVAERWTRQTFVTAATGGEFLLNFDAAAVVPSVSIDMIMAESSQWRSGAKD
jgi:hypothetical protein